MSKGRAGRDLQIKDRPGSCQGDLLREPWHRKQSWGDRAGKEVAFTCPLATGSRGGLPALPVPRRRGH